MTLFGRTPAMWLGALTALLAVLTSLPFAADLGLTGDAAAWVVTVASALFTVYEAWTVRPWSVPMLSGALRTTIAAVVLFGVPISDELAGSVVAFASVVMAMLVTANGTPTADPAPGFDTRSGLSGPRPGQVV
jgi:hypothetical protein